MKFVVAVAVEVIVSVIFGLEPVMSVSVLTTMTIILVLLFFFLLLINFQIYEIKKVNAVLLLTQFFIVKLFLVKIFKIMKNSRSIK